MVYLMVDLDTRQKRESGFGISLAFTRVLPLADGSDADSEDERAHLVMNYNGIAAGAAPEAAQSGTLLLMGVGR